MAAALKEVFTRPLLERVAEALKEAEPGFRPDSFLEHVFDEEWADRELKQRIRHIAEALGATLSPRYPEAVRTLEAISGRFQGFEYLFFPDFVERFGLADEHWDISVAALERFTSGSSSEFAVRPFIRQDPERMMRQMRTWADHPNHHVRRLASEGCRPRLPWGMALEVFKRDPAPIVPILETLKRDESEYVRRSVANNLNDIAKDHPEQVLRIARAWYGEHPDTDRIVRHACRTLLKRGEPEALRLFGLAPDIPVTAERLELSADALRIGESLEFSVDVVNPTEQAVRTRVEYAVDYVKASGKASRKLFQLSEREYPPGRSRLTRSHRFADLTTRRHYPGLHRIHIAVNGNVRASAEFRLLAANGREEEPASAR